MQALVKLTAELSGRLKGGRWRQFAGGTHFSVLLCFIMAHGNSNVLSLRQTLTIKIVADSLR